MTALTNNWYRCTIDKKLLKSLSRRSDRPALLWFGGYFLLLAVFAMGVVATWGTLWAWVFAVLYGSVWGCAASGVHETCHGTQFRTRWLNEAALWAFGWMVLMEPISVRWGHAGHHSFTHFDVGDTELSEPNPVGWGRLFMVGSGVGGTFFYWKSLLCQAFGHVSDEMREVIPQNEVQQAINNARIMVGLYALVIAWAVLAQSWLPIVLTFAARIIGGLVTGLLHLTQHTGLQMNIRDHRYSTRSFTASPATQFFYFNMNHHVEHHRFPMVPFYNLGQLSAALSDQLPEPCNGLAGVYGEIIRAVIRQYREPGHFIRKVVPALPPQPATSELADMAAA